MRVKKRKAALDYRFCNQIVSVYRKEANGEITRFVLEHAFFDFSSADVIDRTGRKTSGGCLLIVPNMAFWVDGWITLRTNANEIYDTINDEDYGFYGIDYSQGIQTPLKVDDKVILGTLSESITNREDWARLIPANYENLVVIKSVDPKFYDRQIVHWEARS